MKVVYFFVVVLFLAVAFYHLNKKASDSTLIKIDSVENVTARSNDSIVADPVKKIIVADTIPAMEINTRNISVDSIVNFAETLIGTPYKYASTNRDSGFDCSGFITYIFNHFNINVPRSSIDFTNVGKEIPLADSKKGDFILFTGTDSTEKFVGHMGIITQNDNADIKFIHSSSGKANGVVITPMSDYYKKRFVKVVRVFPSLPIGSGERG